MSQRPTNNWGGGDLPAPWAQGDVVDVPAGAAALERMDGLLPGRYKIVYATSIGEGDAWYFRLAKFITKGPCSGRLHVMFDRTPDRDWRNDTNLMEGCVLVRTLDPDGLALRNKMLADGWQYVEPAVCPTCKQTVR